MCGICEEQLLGNKKKRKEKKPRFACRGTHQAASPLGLEERGARPRRDGVSRCPSAVRKRTRESNELHGGDTLLRRPRRLAAPAMRAGLTRGGHYHGNSWCRGWMTWLGRGRCGEVFVAGSQGQYRKKAICHVAFACCHYCLLSLLLVLHTGVCRRN